MIGVGAFGATAGALQLVVPSYGLRLVRRFGTHRVGWFLVTAFVSLAALHLLEPMNPTTAGSPPDVVLNIVYAIGSVLLLVGMGHMDTFFSQYEVLCTHSFIILESKASKQEVCRILSAECSKESLFLA